MVNDRSTTPPPCPRGVRPCPPPTTWKRETLPGKENSSVPPSGENPASIHYTDHGGPADAPILVLIHGIGGSLSNWDDVAPRLTDHGRVYAIDLPGFGQTPSAGRRTTVTANAAAVGQFITSVIGQPVVLVGSSMGALISLLLAADQPHLVRALVLIGAPWPPTGTPRVPRDVALSAAVGGMPGVGEILIARRLARVAPAQRVAQTFQRCCANPTRVSAALREAAIANEELVTRQGIRRAHDYLTAARSIIRTLALRQKHRARLAGLPQPVLMLHGLHDQVVPVALARTAVEHLRQVTYRELDAGHIAHMEVPHEVAAHVVPWLYTVTTEERCELTQRAEPPHSPAHAPTAHTAEAEERP